MVPVNVLAPNVSPLPMVTWLSVVGVDPVACVTGASPFAEPAKSDALIATAAFAAEPNESDDASTSELT